VRVRIVVRKETFDMLMKRANSPGFNFMESVKVMDNGMVSFSISEEVAERLDLISRDPETALLLLLQGRVS
jgi:hypothetical protein